MAIFLKKGIKRPPDYYAFFIMGIIWLVFGIPLKNYTLSFMGLVFALAGLVNKNKWKENRQRRETLTPGEKKWRMAVLIILGILVLAGLVFFLLAERRAL
ncbi:MAG: hypothetical protein PHZ04_00365 [Patescibacteria group bacterium]|nr:hypothetical protein [Patescibacteria group bacterium]MDD5295058.1 hypothetical protein [Patescibacteria group bacterium]MDD5555032.1 hypothetical protein [Patescibacteria group bacterium]